MRIGRQTPTTSVTLPYNKTYGRQAGKIYGLTGNTLLEWQQLLLLDMMAVNDDKLWTHNAFGLAVSRRNGKTEVIYARELWGVFRGEKIMHTAHHTKTTRSSWERMETLLDAMGAQYTVIRATGRERITVVGGGLIEYRCRTSKTGLGEGYDLLVIDEAQEYTDDQNGALKYMITSSKNPQMIYAGTPPTTTSAGTVFKGFREIMLSGDSVNSGWAEWAVEKMTDPHDIEAWYETNPGLGTIFQERNVLREIGTDQTDFNIQRLGLWLKYEQKSAVTAAEWDELKVDKPDADKSEGLFVGIKYGHDGVNVALSIAVKRPDGRIFVEAYRCAPVRAGTRWIVEFLSSAKVSQIVIDGANGQQGLADDLKEAHIKPRPTLPKVGDIIAANADFERGVFDKKICHSGQESLAQVVSNCTKRPIGSHGGFGYKALVEGDEIALMDSVILAYWACVRQKEPRPQGFGF